MEPRVNIRQTEFDIAITCLHYLSFPCFDPNLTDDAILAFLNKGYYSFQDFAIAYWWDYLFCCINMETRSLQETERLSSVLGKLLNRYFLPEPPLTEASGSPTSSDPQSRILRQLQALQPTTKSLPLGSKASEKLQLQGLEEQLQRRRMIFEARISTLSPKDPSDLTIFYGDAEGWLKCAKPQCFAFSEGFPTPAVRNNHQDKHDRPYRCSESRCTFASLGFTTSKGLRKHHSEAHPNSHGEISLEFPASNSTTFSRNKSLDSPSHDMPMNPVAEELHFPAPRVSASRVPGEDATIDNAAPPDKAVTDLDASVKRPRMPRKIQGVIIGVWRDSDQPNDEDKHVIHGFIDIHDRLRTRIFAMNRQGQELIANIPTGAGGCWVTFERIIFEPHLKTITAAEVRAYVKIRSDMKAGTTPEEKKQLDMDAVAKAKAIVAQHDTASPGLEN
jgi:hypothetical protein